MIKTVSADIIGKPGQVLTQETKQAVRASIQGMLGESGADEAGIDQALKKLDKLLEESSPSIEKLSAQSIAKSLEAVSEGMDGICEGIMALGYSLDKQGRGRQVFEMGKALGFVDAAQALLSSAGYRVMHAIECDCTKEPKDEPKDEAEAETIPPPPPEAPGATP